MAKRKSINKRSSKYSRYSSGSAILNPDTDIIGDEYPYWWKNLEDNTVVRASTGSNMLNETSRQLDSNSQVEESQAMDGWWKVLEVSNIPDSSKTNKIVVEKGTTNNTLTSESEEEPRITKRKFPLRSKTRKSRNNMFLNVLNDRVTIADSEVVEKAGKTSSSNEAASGSKTITNVTFLNETQENSSNRSESTGNVLKSKPNIFKKNYKTQDRNVFVDILKGDDLKSSLMRKHSTASPSTELQIIKEQSIPVTIGTSVTDDAVSRQLVLSFESDQDFSSFPAPNAHSTTLEASISLQSRSSTEREIIKPKSKFLTRNYRNTMRNRFKNVFEDQESFDKVQKEVQKVQEGTSKDSMHSIAPNISKTSTDIIDKRERDRVKEMRASNANKMDEGVISLTRNDNNKIKRITESSSLVENSTVSDDRSNVNRDVSPVAKLRSRFLTKSRKNREKNLFQDVLGERKSTDTLTSSKSKHSLNRSEKRNSVVINAVSTKEEKNRQSEGNRESNSDSTNFHLKLSAALNEDDDATIATTENDRFCVNVTKMISGENKRPLESSDTQDTLNEQSKNSSSSQKRSLLHGDTNRVSSVSERVKGTAERKNRNSNSTGKQSASRVTLEIGEVERSEIQDTMKRQSSRFNKLQKSSFLRGIEPESFEEDAVESNAISKRDSRGLSRTQKESVSVVAMEIEPINVQDTSKNQNDRSITLQKRSLLSSESQSEGQEIDGVPKRRVTRNTTRRTIEEEVAAKEVKKLNESENISKRQSIRSNRSQKEESTENTAGRLSISKRRSSRLTKSEGISLLRGTNESSEEAEAESSTERDDGWLNRIRKESVSIDEEDAESSKEQGIPKRQSDSPSKSRKRSPFSSEGEGEGEGESEGEEIDGVAKRRDVTRSTNRETTVEEEVAAEETEKVNEIGNISKRQSVRSNRSQREEWTEDTAGRLSISKRRSSRVTKSEGISLLRGTNESSEEVEAESSTERDDGRLNRIRKESVSIDEEDAESSKEQGIPKRQSDSPSKSRKRSPFSSEGEGEGEGESEGEEIDGVAKRRDVTRSTNRETVEEEVVAKETEKVNETGNISKRQSVRSNRSQREESTEDAAGRRSILKRYTSEGTSLLRGTNESSEEAEAECSTERNAQRIDKDVNTSERRSSGNVSEVAGNNGKRQKIAENSGKRSSKIENVTSSRIGTYADSNTNVSKGQKSIRSFLKVDKTLPASQVLWDKEKVERIKRELEKVKKREMAGIKTNEKEKKYERRETADRKKIKRFEKKVRLKSGAEKEVNSRKQVHKAFLVNGQVYKVPRLPRPQRWITDRLYNYLWKRMEPKFKLETRVVSEKFIQRLSSITVIIMKRKSYSKYKAEMYALMKEMARLGIIRTRNDFYQFCHDFFPYELRVKTVPMLLPENGRNIPYNADKLHEPILDS